MRTGQAPPVDVSDAAIADATNKWLRDHCDRRYLVTPSQRLSVRREAPIIFGF